MATDLQELLKLTELDVYELASSNEDAVHFLAELAVLHKREVGTALYTFHKALRHFTE